MPKSIPYNIAIPSVLPSITAPGFEVRINQIARLFFQLLGTPFANAAAMKLKANWDTLIAASDASKVVFSALCSNTKIAMSKDLGIGGDTNTTYRGIPEYFGEGFSKMGGSFRGKDAASMSSLVDLTEFSLMNSAGSSTLGCYFMNNDGQFFCNADFSPIQIWNFSLRSRGTEGLNSNDVIDWSIDLAPNWDATIIPVVPSFDPRLY